MIPNRILSGLLLIVLIPVAMACGTKSQNDPGSDNKDIPSQQEEVTQPSPSSGALEAALQEAALNGNADIVSSMIRDGVDVNATDQENRTALMYAAFNGHKEIVSELIGAGAEVGLRDVSGRTALLYASTGPFPETVKFLLENNADPNIKDAVESFTPLMHAAAEGQLEVVKILLEYGADPSLRDTDGETAYMFAVNNGHTEVASLLEPK